MKLTAQKREVKGTSGVRRLRRESWIPAVIYGEGRPGETIQIRRHDFEQAMRGHKGEHMLIDLEVEGQKPRKVLIKDTQHEPVTGKIIHADFHEISMTKKLRVEVPVRLVGDAVGVTQQGGVLEHVLRSLEIECLPADIPEFLEVDVSGLSIGHSVTVADVKVDRSRFTILSSPELAVAAVAAPKAEEEVAAPAAEAAPTEPEVIREKKPEEGEEEAAEGGEAGKEAKEKKEAPAKEPKKEGKEKK
jgi:large subunit ribosomal protein L25